MYLYIPQALHEIEAPSSSYLQTPSGHPDTEYSDTVYSDNGHLDFGQSDTGYSDFGQSDNGHSVSPYLLTPSAGHQDSSSTLGQVYYYYPGNQTDSDVEVNIN